MPSVMLTLSLRNAQGNVSVEYYVGNGTVILAAIWLTKSWDPARALRLPSPATPPEAKERHRS